MTTRARDLARFPTPFLTALALALLPGCSALRNVAGEGGHFVELYPIARTTCTASLEGTVGETTVAVHYAPELGTAAAEQFLAGLADHRAEVEGDYALFRTSLEAYLGAELWGRLDHRFLQPPATTTEWYLLPGPMSALIWRGPLGSSYHFLPPHDPPFTDEEVRITSHLEKGEVHERTHWLIQMALQSERGHFPRWLEEGTCEYTQMQFARRKNKTWDGGREVVARLTWEREEVRKQVLSWPSDGFHAKFSAWREKSWESDLLYRGSLGLVFALESELGSYGLMQLYRDLLQTGPETDAATVAFLEERVGKPLGEVGRMTAEARRQLLDTLLDRAASACGADPGATGDVPLGALGHFPEAAERVRPALEALALCPVMDVAGEGLTGLRWLGDRRALAATIDRIEDSDHAEINDALSTHSGGAFGMAAEFVKTGGRASRWFGRPPRGPDSEATMASAR